MTRETWLERVRDEENKILREEGAAHVGGRYFADEHSANLQRRWEAEVRASRALARDMQRPPSSPATVLTTSASWFGKGR
jgi:hypothetical protein